MNKQLLVLIHTAVENLSMGNGDGVLKNLQDAMRIVAEPFDRSKCEHELLLIFRECRLPQRMTLLTDYCERISKGAVQPVQPQHKFIMDVIYNTETFMWEAAIKTLPIKTDNHGK